MSNMLVYNYFFHHERDVMIVNTLCTNDMACGRFKQHISFTKMCKLDDFLAKRWPGFDWFCSNGHLRFPKLRFIMGSC